ncbi:MAG: restriction endonuclease [Candidatus Gastranaerophilales bacterium]|nr:restriction endonuclease [Candidatus Gastranaerophilales bacterium]
MQLLIEIKKQIKSLLDSSDEFFLSKWELEINELPKVLCEEEKIEKVMKGSYSNNQMGILIATDKRLLYLKKNKFQTGNIVLDFKDFIYEKIISINYDNTFLYDNKTVTISFRSVSNKNKELFFAFLRDKIINSNKHKLLMQTEKKDLECSQKENIIYNKDLSWDEWEQNSPARKLRLQKQEELNQKNELKNKKIDGEADIELPSLLTVNKTNIELPSLLIVKLNNYVKNHIKKSGFIEIEIEDIANYYQKLYYEDHIHLPFYTLGFINALVDYLNNAIFEFKTKLVPQYKIAFQLITQFVSQFIEEENYPDEFSLKEGSIKALYYMITEKFNIEIPHTLLNEYVIKEIEIQNLEIFKKLFYQDNPELLNNKDRQAWIKAYINIFENNFNYSNYFVLLLNENQIDLFSLENKRQDIEKAFKSYYKEEVDEEEYPLHKETLEYEVEKILNKKGVGWKIIYLYHLKELLNKEIEERHLRELSDIYKENMITGKKFINNSLTIEDIDQLEGLEFEQILGKLFAKLGYKIEVTKGSGDQGADLIIEKIGKRTVIQAKCYSNVVGNKAIQEAVAAKAHYNCTAAIVVTNNYFTKSAMELAGSNNVELWDREVLEERLNLYPVTV